MANNWLITGTSSGFGRTLTELALERGDNVVATVRKPSALGYLQVRYENRLRVSILDVTNPKEIVSVVDDAFDAFGKIDFAVSNAGYIMVGAAEEAELSRIERLLDTNLLGSIVFAKAVIPHMRKQGGGRILQISSEQSQMEGSFRKSRSSVSKSRWLNPALPEPTSRVRPTIPLPWKSMRTRL